MARVSFPDREARTAEGVEIAYDAQVSVDHTGTSAISLVAHDPKQQLGLNLGLKQELNELWQDTKVVTGIEIQKCQIFTPLGEDPAGSARECKVANFAPDGTVSDIRRGEGISQDGVDSTLNRIDAEHHAHMQDLSAHSFTPPRPVDV